MSKVQAVVAASAGVPSAEEGGGRASPPTGGRRRGPIVDNGEADGEEGDSPMRWFEDGEAGELAEKGMLSDSPQWQSGLGLRKLAKELGERGTEHLEIAKKMWESLKPPVGAPVATHREQRPPGIDMGHTPREDDDAKAATPPNASSSGRTPWSPLTRPMVTAFQEGVVKPGQIMGKRLAEVWDIHDLFDDVKQQRDFIKANLRTKNASIDEGDEAGAGTPARSPEAALAPGVPVEGKTFPDPAEVVNAASPRHLPPEPPQAESQSADDKPKSGSFECVALMPSTGEDSSLSCVSVGSSPLRSAAGEEPPETPVEMAARLNLY